MFVRRTEKKAGIARPSSKTSGSSGKLLSHLDILGNVAQFNALLNAKKHDAILASLPFFHSFVLLCDALRFFVLYIPY